MMIWGKYTWIFFHTLVEKIKDEHFHQHKNMLCGIIARLCSCLPCPTCKDHAMETLRKRNIYAVRSKEDLKMYIYQFHNTVSYKKGMPTPDLSVLEQYKYGNLRRIVQVFRQHFTTNVPGLMTQQLKRRAVLNQCMNELNKYWHIFNP